MREEGGAVDPVFLDRTGRCRRLFVAAGSAGGLLLLVAMVALLARFTGAGPGSVSGWPGAEDLRISRPDPAVSVRPRATKTRPPAKVTSAPARRTTAPAAPVTTTAAPTSAAPSVTPSASTNPHRRVPTHTPNPRKSKG
jgi:hypothetical protein